MSSAPSSAMKSPQERFLVEAIREGNATNFHVLFEGWERENRGLSAQQRKDTLNLLLHKACSATFRFPSLSGTPSIVQALLKAGADPNCCLPEGRGSPMESCLLARVLKNRKERSAPTVRILKVLLEFGADPTEISADTLCRCDPSVRRIVDESAQTRRGLNLLLANRKHSFPG